MEEEEKKELLSERLAELRLDQNEEVKGAGIDIGFPYQPYDVQRQYMDTVVEGLRQRKNSLLESPTGTGKTLSLLCAGLAWTSSRKPLESHKIYYCSRTHLQLSQALNELKKTSYHPRTVTLGSRDQLCIHPVSERLKGIELINKCKQLRKSNKCPYFNQKLMLGSEEERGLLDIEELKKMGESRKCCPYYYTKQIQPHAELTFMPYNYLLDPRIRKRYDSLEFGDNVLIFDEAHNVARAVEDASSFEISVGLVDRCLDELKHLERVLELCHCGEDEGKYSAVKEEVRNIRSVEDLWEAFGGMGEYLRNMEDPGTEGVSVPTADLFEIVTTATASERFPGVSAANYRAHLSKLGLCVEVLLEDERGTSLQQWHEIVESMFGFMRGLPVDPTTSSSMNDFGVILCNEFEEKKWQLSKSEWVKCRNNFRTIKVFCLNPGIGFAELQKKNPRSIILTSGTLSPLDSFEKELKLSFPQKLEGKHIIKSTQLNSAIVAWSDDGSPFEFSFKTRGDEGKLERLGKLLREIVVNTKGGVLCFFSSYATMTTSIKLWNSQYRDPLQKLGYLSFIEDRNPSKNRTLLEQYQRYTENGGNGVLFAVMRGKVSEGLDFKDNCARTVVIVGIPFAPINDKRVILKRKYLDRQDASLQLSGNVWYVQDAIRAVNQSVGRLIRHKDDYGNIILVDSRFANSSNLPHVSKWIREYGIATLTQGECIRRLKEFGERHSGGISVGDGRQVTAGATGSTGAVGTAGTAGTAEATRAAGTAGTAGEAGPAVVAGASLSKDTREDQKDQKGQKDQKDGRSEAEPVVTAEIAKFGAMRKLKSCLCPESYENIKAICEMSDASAELLSEFLFPILESEYCRAHDKSRVADAMRESHILLPAEVQGAYQKLLEAHFAQLGTHKPSQ